MSFLNWALLGGAAAFLVPLLIHLLNRSRFRTVEWGAMHLLETAIQSNNRRIKIEQLILLLIRCAIPIIFAACLARPVLTNWQTLPGETPKSMVVLLDNSYSMEAQGTSGSLYDQAVSDLTEVVSQLHVGSEITVLCLGGRVTPLFDSAVFDADMVVKQLRERPGGYSAVDTAGGLQAALTALSEASHQHREILLVSDFQKANWTNLDEGFEQRIAGELDQQAVRPQVTMLKIPTQQRDNICLDSFDYSRAALGVGQTLRLRANLRNYGEKSYAAVNVTLLVDGKSESVTQLPLAAGATSQVLFTHQFEVAGSHVVEVVVDADDGLQQDNRLAASITVIDRIDVLLVDGAPSRTPLESETDFLSAALTPFATGASRLSDLIRVKRGQPGQLSEQLLAECQVVVLANVARLSDGELSQLAAAVEQGVSLLQFPGDKTDTQWHNSKLKAAGLLPMELGKLQGDAQKSVKQTRILAQRFSHPALALFNDRSNGNLANGQIRNWFQLRGSSPSLAADATGSNGQDAASQVTVMARLDSGQPFLVEKRHGAGMVVQCATACDNDWSNLPSRPFFVPLMQEVVVKLAARVDPPRNFSAGDTLAAILPSEREGQPLTLTTPNGQQLTVRPRPVGRTSLVEFSQTHLPGIYRLATDEETVINFVATAPRSESNLQTLAADEITKLAETWDAYVVSSVAERRSLEDIRQNGREIWLYVLLAVFILLILEVLLQQRFAQGVSA